MRATLCDTCRANVNPEKHPNYFGHSHDIKVPKSYETYTEGNYQYDFCSKECRKKWFGERGKVDLSEVPSELMADELDRRMYIRRIYS